MKRSKMSLGQAIDTLDKRREFLHGRIRGAEDGGSPFDKAEATALLMALPILRREQHKALVEAAARGNTSAVRRLAAWGHGE